MSPAYPTSLGQIEVWRRATGVTVDEARKRFVQFVTLVSIAGRPAVGGTLAFKGGNALRFLFGSPRSTVDLDFTVTGGLPDTEPDLRRVFDDALRTGGRKHGIKVRCQRVHRNPPSPAATRPTYEIKVGFQFPGDRYFADYEATDRAVPSAIVLEVSFNDVVCETEYRPLGPDDGATIRACTLNDIVAEKLRALLQQVPRGRTRPQDVFDIARIVRLPAPALDLGRVAEYLVRKCVEREVTATRAAFRNPEVERRAGTGYDDILKLTQGEFPPFAEAWAVVLSLVDRLDIPDG
ncbi:MAG: nucleotidyl transferase AbiEii/AbiGii toxin family protein [Gemmataceae bacterium]